jgi:hypothetical protein
MASTYPNQFWAQDTAKCRRLGAKEFDSARKVFGSRCGHGDEDDGSFTTLEFVDGIDSVISTSIVVCENFGNSPYMQIDKIL